MGRRIRHPHGRSDQVIQFRRVWRSTGVWPSFLNKPHSDTPTRSRRQLHGKNGHAGPCAPQHFAPSAPSRSTCAQGQAEQGKHARVGDTAETATTRNCLRHHMQPSSSRAQAVNAARHLAPASVSALWPSPCMPEARSWNAETVPSNSNQSVPNAVANSQRLSSLFCPPGQLRMHTHATVFILIMSVLFYKTVRTIF